MTKRIACAIALIALSGCEGVAIEDENVLDELDRSSETRLLPVSWNPMLGGGPDGLPSTCNGSVDPESTDREMVLVVRCGGEQAGFGGLMTSVNVSALQGKRVRYSAELEAENISGAQTVQGFGSLWVLAQTPRGLIRGNTRSNGVTGTTEWLSREMVFDLPAGTTTISIGFFLQGYGSLRIRDWKLQQVPSDIPTTI